MNSMVIVPPATPKHCRKLGTFRSRGAREAGCWRMRRAEASNGRRLPNGARETLGPFNARGRRAEGRSGSEARLSNKSAVAAEPVGITLSVRNVSQSAVLFVDRPVAPEAWVRDATGTPARLSRKGVDLFGEPTSNAGLIGNVFSENVRPGFAVGYDFPLTEYFVLERPGTYTVLVTKQVEFPRGAVWLVAKPLVVERRPRVPRATGAAKDPDVVKPAVPAGLNVPIDKEWISLAAKAPNVVDGLVLEAVDSPVAKGKAQLVVSLLCENVVGTLNEDYLPKFGSVAADYRILVRDSAGHPAPKRKQTPKIFRQ